VTDAEKRGNTAPVFDISRASLHDGPGVRTVVYLKGCPLRCLWCHNPEGQSPQAQILYHAAKCIGCGRCAAVCSLGLHNADGGGRHIFNRSCCIGCGCCAEACPTGALTICGKNMAATEVMAEVKKDKRYFDATGGGVTLSGGEALLYPDFTAELFRYCRVAEIHTAIETSLHAPRENLGKLLPLTDLLIADFKHSDGAEIEGSPAWITY
jgi:pyruvate formate lyase activating enzyme